MYTHSYSFLIGNVACFPCQPYLMLHRLLAGAHSFPVQFMPFPQVVTPKQLEGFADVSVKAHKDATVANYRMIQPINGRQVYNYVA